MDDLGVVTRHEVEKRRVRIREGERHRKYWIVISDRDILLMFISKILGCVWHTLCARGPKKWMQQSLRFNKLL